MMKLFIFIFYCGGILFVVDVLYFKLMQKLKLINNPVIIIPFLFINSLLYDWISAWN